MDNKVRVLICCIGKNENRYIKEFVEYYKNIGVTNICLYDNNKDGEEDFRDAIGEYIDSNFVFLKDYRNRTVCQLEAYNECYSEYGNKYDWVAFFDIDEYLSFGDVRYNTISDYLSEDFFKGYDMININWMIYGDSNQLEYEDKPLNERFSKPIKFDTKIAYDFPENNHIKSMVRGGLGNINFDCTPHCPENIGLKQCNECGIGHNMNYQAPFLVYSYKKAYLKHYTTKTVEEYCDKMKRGFPDQLWDGSKIENLIATRFFRTNEITEEKIKYIKETLAIDLSYLLDNKKKSIILCMSCNNQRYIDEETIIRKTWGKDILAGKYNNIDLYFYRGGANENYLDKENHIIYLKSPDDLFGTYEKTIDAFKWLIENNKEFDYIIRTNTSTYVNVKAIEQFSSMDDIKDDVAFGPNLIINNSNNRIPFLGGYFLIFPKKIVNVLINNNIEGIGIDDADFGKSLFYEYRGNYLEQHVMEVDIIADIKKPYFKDLNKAYCVRVKDKDNYENNIINMIGLHIIYNTLNIETKINPPHNFTRIDTIFGKIPI